ncbi:hypothetical protein [Dyella flagellata]|uniref:Uncharacterized protein n=1 Tax=Dyella flagellata TaxID=1867833 RepID=A0ABQ5XB37_9GAMM|nr:hypothetical protein [Dyella flagellata]GLQ88874.1 hypothetical protein GCM10007898_24450 [Dyella flagellata]
MVSQYVFPSSRGLFRIAKHGHRWRSLVEAQEVARHDSPEAALDALREAWPQARLPQALSEWRYVAEAASLPYARLARATNGIRVVGIDPSQPRVRRSRRVWGRPSRDVTDHG